MPLALGLDAGTTHITAVAVDLDSGRPAAVATFPAPGNIAGPTRFEFDADAIAGAALQCLAELAGRLGPGRELVGLAVTGQQHGMVVVDAQLHPLSPFINWQDRRGDEPRPGESLSWAESARRRLGAAAPRRTGCRLATGYMGLTLFWLAQQSALPPGTACFIVDYLTARLTGLPPVVDPTCAASSGLLDVSADDWAFDEIAALGLPRDLFPPVLPCGAARGGLTAEAAQATGLPLGLPVFVGLGDNQASFLGSVPRPAETTLVNVGTGGQVGVFTPHFAYDPALEARPFPGGGFLLVSAGLVGGASYALLERFFRQVGLDLRGEPAEGSLFAAMNRQAALAPPGAEGLRCEPFFFGARQHPERRGSWTGVSAANFTPGHLARALLEGMAQVFADSHRLIRRLHSEPARELVGAGNGVRDNPLLAQVIGQAFGLPLQTPAHREEAATGAALLAAVGAGAFTDLAAAAARVVRLAPAG